MKMKYVKWNEKEVPVINFILKAEGLTIFEEVCILGYGKNEMNINVGGNLVKAVSRIYI